MTTRRRWLPLVAGIAILLVFVGIGVVLVGVSWMRERLEVVPASESDAEGAFDAVRARLPNRPPLIEMRDGRPVYRGGEKPGGSPASSVNTLHVLAWNPRDERLARVEVPFWVLRLKSTPIQFGAYASGFDEAGMRIRIEDVEGYGPGLIADLTLKRGERVLVWAD